MQNIEKEVIEEIKKFFKVKHVTVNMYKDDINGWDELTNIYFFMLLSKLYRIDFTHEDIYEYNRIENIVDIIYDKIKGV